MLDVEVVHWLLVHAVVELLVADLDIGEEQRHHSDDGTAAGHEAALPEVPEGRHRDLELPVAWSHAPDLL